MLVSLIYKNADKQSVSKNNSSVIQVSFLLIKIINYIRSIPTISAKSEYFSLISSGKSISFSSKKATVSLYLSILILFFTHLHSYSGSVSFFRVVFQIIVVYLWHRLKVFTNMPHSVTYFPFIIHAILTSNF